MEISISEVASLAIQPDSPATLRDLLSLGKKMPPEATSLLILDHAEVTAMFQQYDMEQAQELKAILAGKICMALTVHAIIEEELFYPAAAAALEDDELINEAVEEHGEMKEEIAKIVEGLAASKSVTRNVKKLMQLVEDHVAEEESEMFPDVRQTSLDLYDLGARMAARRVEALLTLRREAMEV